MNSKQDSAHKLNLPKHPYFGISAILLSVSIAILIYTNLVTPFPSREIAYFICVVIGIVGVVQIGTWALRR